MKYNIFLRPDEAMLKTLQNPVFKQLNSVHRETFENLVKLLNSFISIFLYSLITCGYIFYCYCNPRIIEVHNNRRVIQEYTCQSRGNKHVLPYNLSRACAFNIDVNKTCAYVIPSKDKRKPLKYFTIQVVDRTHS